MVVDFELKIQVSAAFFLFACVEKNDGQIKRLAKILSTSFRWAAYPRKNRFPVYYVHFRFFVLNDKKTTRTHKNSG